MGIAAVSLDGYIADENDHIGPLFEWLESGDVAWSIPGSPQESRSTQPSVDFMLRHYGDNVAATVIGRRLFDLTNGWNGSAVGSDHVFVVTHEPPADSEFADKAPFTFVDGVAEAIAAAREFAGERDIDVAAGQIGSQALARLDRPDRHQLGPRDSRLWQAILLLEGRGDPIRLENSSQILQGDRVTHLVYDVTPKEDA